MADISLYDSEGFIGSHTTQVIPSIGETLTMYNVDYTVKSVERTITRSECPTISSNGLTPFVHISYSTYESFIVRLSKKPKPIRFSMFE